MITESLLTVNEASVFIFSLVIVLSWYLLTRRPKNYPPSPGLALPFLGHLYLMNSNPRKQFKKWAQNLGDAFSLQMGSTPVVVLSSYDKIKEAYAKKADSFSGRALTDFINAHVPHRRKGIAFSSGSFWKTQRTTSLTILRTLGMGKNVLALKISEEIVSLLDEIDKNNGEPTDLKSLISNSIANIITSVIFGKRFNYKDPKFIKFMHLSNSLVKLFNGITLINYWHFLKYVPFDPFHAKKLLNTIKELRQITEEMIQEATTSTNTNQLDTFIKIYLNELKKQNASGRSNDLDTLSLAGAVDDLFSAGSETASTTILWCILYSLHYPEVQEKVYKEIVQEVGTKDPPTVLDKPKLKYLNAYIMETQRLASIVPLGLAHLCTEDSTIGGFSIPKGTCIMSNLDGVFHDDKVWGDPQNFRPERFINAAGCLITKEELIPFSTGPRACVGEGMAKMELYLFMACLFQKFQFVPVDPNNLPPLDEEFGITVPPVRYQVKCVRRTPSIFHRN